jgi:hypothetical protein
MIKVIEGILKKCIRIVFKHANIGTFLKRIERKESYRCSTVARPDKLKDTSLVTVKKWKVGYRTPIRDVV